MRIKRWLIQIKDKHRPRNQDVKTIAQKNIEFANKLVQEDIDREIE